MELYTSSPDRRSRGSARRAGRLALGATVLAVVTALAACSPGGTPAEQGDAETVNIAVLASQTGPYAAYGQAVFGGVKLAVQEINEEGFEVDGATYKFNVIEADDASDPATAVSEARKVMQEDAPIAMFGPSISSLALPVMKITQTDGSLVQFTLSAGVAAALKNEPETVPLAVVSNNSYAAAGGVMERAAEYAYEQGIRTIVSINQDDAGAHEYTPAFEEAFERAGGEILASEYAPADTSDFGPYLSRYADLKPDALFFGISDAFMIGLMTQARQTDFAPWYVAGPGSSAAAFDSGDSTFEQFIYPQVIGGFDDPSEATQSYIDDYVALNGDLNGLSYQSAGSYPFVYALVDAMKAAGTVTDAAAIMAELRGHEFEGHGPITALKIDETGQSAATFKICDLVADGEPTCKEYDPS